MALSVYIREKLLLLIPLLACLNQLICRICSELEAEKEQQNTVNSSTSTTATTDYPLETANLAVHLLRTTELQNQPYSETSHRQSQWQTLPTAASLLGGQINGDICRFSVGQDVQIWLEQVICKLVLSKEKNKQNNRQKINKEDRDRENSNTK